MNRALALLLAVLLAVPGYADEANAGVSDAGVTLPTDIPSQALLRATLVTVAGETLDVTAGCWLSQRTCLGTGLLEARLLKENELLKQNVVDAHKDKWQLIAIISGVVAAVFYAAGYFSARIRLFP